MIQSTDQLYKALGEQTLATKKWRNRHATQRHKTKKAQLRADEAKDLLRIDRNMAADRPTPHLVTYGNVIVGWVNDATAERLEEVKSRGTALRLEEVVK